MACRRANSEHEKMKNTDNCSQIKRLIFSSQTKLCNFTYFKKVKIANFSLKPEIDFFYSPKIFQALM